MEITGKSAIGDTDGEDMDTIDIAFSSEGESSDDEGPPLPDPMMSEEDKAPFGHGMAGKAAKKFVHSVKTTPKTKARLMGKVPRSVNPKRAPASNVSDSDVTSKRSSASDSDLERLAAGEGGGGGGGRGAQGRRRLRELLADAAHLAGDHEHRRTLAAGAGGLPRPSCQRRGGAPVAPGRTRVGDDYQVPAAALPRPTEQPRAPPGRALGGGTADEKAHLLWRPADAAARLRGAALGEFFAAWGPTDRAHTALHRARYNAHLGCEKLVMMPEEKEWTEVEKRKFDDAMYEFGKEFSQIRKKYLPKKSVKQLVEYYYKHYKKSEDYKTWKKEGCEVLNNSGIPDFHNEVCEECQQPGDLVCCATCPAAYHPPCVPRRFRHKTLESPARPGDPDPAARPAPPPPPLAAAAAGRGGGAAPASPPPKPRQLQPPPRGGAPAAAAAAAAPGGGERLLLDWSCPPCTVGGAFQSSRKRATAARYVLDQIREVERAREAAFQTFLRKRKRLRDKAAATAAAATTEGKGAAPPAAGGTVERAEKGGEDGAGAEGERPEKKPRRPVKKEEPRLLASSSGSSSVAQASVNFVSLKNQVQHHFEEKQQCGVKVIAKAKVTSNMMDGSSSGTTSQELSSRSPSRDPSSCPNHLCNGLPAMPAIEC